eukprot:gene19564-23438_t
MFSKSEITKNTPLLESVEKLVIRNNQEHHRGKPRPVEAQVYTGIALTMPNLRSLVCHRINLEPYQIQELVKCPLLCRINLATIANDPISKVIKYYLNHQQRQNPLTKLLLPKGLVVSYQSLADLHVLGTGPMVLQHQLLSHGHMTKLTKLTLYSVPTNEYEVLTSFLRSPECRIVHLTVIINDNTDFTWITQLLSTNNSIHTLEIITPEHFKVTSSFIFVQLASCLSVNNLILYASNLLSIQTNLVTPGFKLIDSNSIMFVRLDTQIGRSLTHKAYFKRIISS